MPGPGPSLRRGPGPVAVLAALVALVAMVGTVPAAAQPDPTSPPATTPGTTTALVRLPFPQDDGTLTPYTFELGYPLVTLVYDTLMWRDVDGVPQPWLARSVETSEDGRRVTVKLAEGAAWHDGTPLTSADVAFTFDHVARRPHPRFTGEVRVVERVATPDPGTAVITLRQPSPGFRDQPLADLPILPRHLWQGLARDKLAPEGLPVGSGPYRLVEHRPGQGYRFEANPTYFRGPPPVAAIDVPVIRTADATLQALDRREVDMVPVSLPEDLARRVGSVAVTVEEGPSYLGTVLMFNLRAPPFDRPEVRQAVSRALDLGRVARAVGRADPADHGYIHPRSDHASQRVLHEADATAARPVLESLPGPIQIIVSDNDPVKVEAAREVVRSLRAAGGAAEVQTRTREEVGRAVGEDGSAPDFQAAIWVAPALASYDPDFLGRLFGSDPATAPFNFPGYASPAFDALAARIATTPDPGARRAVTEEALALLAADAPVVPLFFATGSFAYRPTVYDGWVFVRGTGILDKRSFVSGGPGPEATTPVPSTGPGDGQGGGGGGVPLGAIGAGLVGVAVLAAAALAAVELRRRRRGG